jgi:hypothetical protein
MKELKLGNMVERYNGKPVLINKTGAICSFSLARGAMRQHRHAVTH